MAYKKRMLSAFYISGLVAATLVCDTTGAGAISSYVFNSDFKSKVLPWINDTSAFVDFMDKYKGKNSFTDQERAEVIVKLGIYEFAPQWLTPKSKSIVEKFYPEIRRKHAEGNYIRKLHLTVINSKMRQSLCSAASLSLLSAPGEFSIAEFSAALGEIFEVNPAMGLAAGYVAASAVAGALLTQAAINAIKATDPQAIPTAVSQVGSQPQSSSPKKGCRVDPGICSVEECIRLQNDINSSCKIRKCGESEEQASIVSKINGLNVCISARAKILYTCYQGKSDVGHIDQIIQNKKQLYDCEKLVTPKTIHQDIPDASHFMGR